MAARFLCAWALVTLALSLVVRAQLRGEASGRCALDGARIATAGRVELFEDGALRWSFCSSECALAWPAPKVPGVKRRFQVHEEQNGRALDPRAATFVRSSLTRVAGRGALRAFADALAASEHVRAHGGALVPNPFP